MLRGDIELYFYENGTLRFLTCPTNKQFAILQTARKVEIKLLLEAQLSLAEAIDGVMEDLKNIALEMDPEDGSVLIDLDGNDTYRSEGPACQGFGFLGAGILADFAGDDLYIGKWVGNAAGNDRSAGIFMDLEGHDRYYAESGDGQGYTHKPFGFSLFIDAGGNDLYSAKDYSQGYVLPPISPDRWGDAIFIDGGGEDSYSMPGRGNDATWHRQAHAVGIDAGVRARGNVGTHADEGIPVEEKRNRWLGLFPHTLADRLDGTGAVASIMGLLFSYYLDFSVGPSVVAFLGLALIVVSLFKSTVNG